MNLSGSPLSSALDLLDQMRADPTEWHYLDLVRLLQAWRFDVRELLDDQGNPTTARLFYLKEHPADTYVTIWPEECVHEGVTRFVIRRIDWARAQGLR